MKLISLPHGHFTMVDDGDFEWLNKWHWFLKYNKSGIPYVVRNQHKAENGIKHTTIRMQRQILGLLNGDDRQADHIDGNTLNNQRYNLRACTQQQNAWNRGRWIKNKSGFKGVSFHAASGKWQAQACLNLHVIYLGLYLDKLDAAHAYNEFASKHHGQFARLNNVNLINKGVL
jgi:hypothetical protein